MIEPPEKARPFATPRVAAGALFVDDQDRVLMLRPTYKPYWDIPGGYVEEGEAPLDACRREVREEIGLDVRVNELLAVDWAPHPDEGDKLLFIFDGGQLTPEQLNAIRFTDGEVEGWSFVGLEQLRDVTVPRLEKRIAQALRAHKDLRTVYLQGGSVPT
ncbi:NUDIX domain-containing protein [Krasilnikovia sp. MM14-A1004]|uniref:NUDIX domain-containing protein n=1 Tax=Krasilnikovia sp. MM14-A1004 TaxID=3373541 RepID=UPI00399D0014